MAFEYQNFASLGVNLNRQKYGPLDISNVFTSENDLKYYLTKGAHIEGVSKYWYESADKKVVPYPYEGQVLATVIDGEVNVYVLAAKEDGTFETREIAGKIEVDGKTIKLDDEGKITLVGLDAVEAGKTYVPSLVNGVLTWAEPDTSTAEGQAQEINALKTRAAALEETVNGTDEVDGLVTRVATNAQAIADETAAREAADSALETKITEALQAAKDYADEKDADTIYDDSDVVARIEAIEEDYLKEADKYDDSAIISRVTAVEGQVEEHTQAISDLEGAYVAADEVVLAAAKTYTDDEIAGLEVAIEKVEGVDHIVIKKADEVITSVNASLFVQDSFLDDVAYDAETGKVTFSWIMGDGSTKSDEIDIAHLVDTYTAGNGLKVENNQFSVDTGVIATVEALEAVREIADAAQTAEEVTAAVEAAFEEADLAKYAIKADVEEALEGKVAVADYEADKATFALQADVEETLEGYYSKDDIDGKGFAVATEVAETYATKEAFEAHVSSADETYAVKADVEEALAKKIETGSIAHSSETLAEGVTVEGTKLNIVVDAYTKEETRNYVAGVIEDMTGGESAADVLLALNNHVDTYNEKVGQLDAKDQALESAIAETKTKAEKGISDAAAVAADLLALASGAVATNTGDIVTLKNQVSSLSDAAAGHTTSIAAIEGEISGLKNADSTINDTLNGHTTKIAALESEDSRLAGLIQGNTDKFAGYDTKEEVASKIAAAIADIPAVDLEPYAKLTDVEALESAINEDISGINAVLADKANAADVYTKDEVAELFMSESEVDERINTLIDGANNEDTIKNVKNLIDFVNENASDIAALVTRVEENADAIAKNAEDIVAINNSITDINDAIAAIIQPKESDEISVAEDGTLGVKALNVNKLVQTDGDTLVLNGGKAN